MFEKVSPSHPDKVADRIAGAIVDLAYKKSDNPKVAVEVLLGHSTATIIIESSENFSDDEISNIVDRITNNSIDDLHLVVVPQDTHLARNQEDSIRCGDNGIFKGVPLTLEEILLSNIAKELYEIIPSDGKFIIDNKKLIICQSGINSDTLRDIISSKYDNFGLDEIIINPLGDWSGGLDVDSGATNRKLGSDMAQSVTGGGLHGKDLSKADVAVNIYAFIQAQLQDKPISFSCAIGDEFIDDVPYSEVVKFARAFIDAIGGFEKFAEWGLCNIYF